MEQRIVIKKLNNDRFTVDTVESTNICVDFQELVDYLKSVFFPKKSIEEDIKDNEIERTYTSMDPLKLTDERMDEIIDSIKNCKNRKELLQIAMEYNHIPERLYQESLKIFTKMEDIQRMEIFTAIYDKHVELWEKDCKQFGKECIK